MSEQPNKKKFLYVNRKAPYGTIYALESLEVVLIGAAFEQEVSLAFLDEDIQGARRLRRAQVLRREGIARRARAVGR